jgi:hypothetical protein
MKIIYKILDLMTDSQNSVLVSSVIIGMIIGGLSGYFLYVLSKGC